MVPPEITDGFVGIGETEVSALGVGERGGVEVVLDTVLLAPLNPALEIFGRNLVAVNELALEVAVDFVEIEAVLAGNERHGIENVVTQFIYVAGFAGIVAVDLYSAGETAFARFKTGYVVSLLAVHAQMEVLHLCENFVGIDSKGRIAFFRYLIRLADCFFFHDCLFLG